MYKPKNVNVNIISTDKGYTWEGNEEGFRAHTDCIIAMYEGTSIGDPEAWLQRHHLFTFKRREAIRRLDLVKAGTDDVETVRQLAKRIGMTVTILEREKDK